MILLAMALWLAPAPALPQVPEFSNAFAGAALAALKAIEGDATVSRVENGSLLIERGVTRSKVDAVDAVGKTLPESRIATDLRLLYICKLRDNFNATRSPGAPQLSAPAFRQMKQAQMRCFTAMEDALRLESSSLPEACQDFVANPPKHHFE